MHQNDYSLTEAEAALLTNDGFVVRRGVVSAAEIHNITAACEQLVSDLLQSQRKRRFAAGAYVFEPLLDLGVSIKWEGDSDVVHGIEPCAHLSPELNRWALDPRFVHPMRAFVGDANPMLFTEKLNLKRPLHGGVNPWHQDYPYWTQDTDVPERVGTAMLFLDDATLENGCLEVVPGSHRQGVWRTRSDQDAFGNLELDFSAYPTLQAVPLEVSAGTVVYFGAFLVHKSEPNRSTKERRVLLFSYQPPGNRTLLQSLRAAAEVRRVRRQDKFP